MSIYKRGDIWYIYYVRNGKRIRRAVSTDKRIAEQILRNELVNLDRKMAGIPCDISLRELVEEYLKYSKANKKEKSYLRDKQHFAHLPDLIDMNLKISQLSSTIQKQMDDYKTSKLSQGASPFTVNGFIMTLKALFSKAVKWNYLVANPLNGLEKVKTMRTPRPRFLSSEEIERVLDACKGELHNAVIMFIYTGLRTAELLYLEWDDIDFSRNLIKIQGKDIWSPKDYECRDIPIHPCLKETLLQQKQTANGSFVFFNSSGSRELDKKLRNTTNGIIYVGLYKKFKRRLARLGIKDVCLHTLRHTFGSHCVMAGIDLPTIAKLMGHADIKTTMIYAHLSPQHIKNAINKLHFDPPPPPATDLPQDAA